MYWEIGIRRVRGFGYEEMRVGLECDILWVGEMGRYERRWKGGIEGLFVGGTEELI